MNQSKTCVRCGKKFSCENGNCWCNKYKIGKEIFNQGYSDCLCPDCLKLYSKE